MIVLLTIWNLMSFRLDPHGVENTFDRLFAKFIAVYKVSRGRKS